MLSGAVFYALNSQNIFWWPGSTRTRRGSLQHLLIPSSRIKGAALRRRREGKGKGQKERKGREAKQGKGDPPKTKILASTLSTTTTAFTKLRHSTWIYRPNTYDTYKILRVIRGSLHRTNCEFGANVATSTSATLLKITPLIQASDNVHNQQCNCHHSVIALSSVTCTKASQYSPATHSFISLLLISVQQERNKIIRVREYLR